MFPLVILEVEEKGPGGGGAGAGGGASFVRHNGSDLST